jgi:hypothetical protein
VIVPSNCQLKRSFEMKKNVLQKMIVVIWNSDCVSYQVSVEFLSHFLAIKFQTFCVMFQH